MNNKEYELELFDLKINAIPSPTEKAL